MEVRREFRPQPVEQEAAQDFGDLAPEAQKFAQGVYDAMQRADQLEPQVERRRLPPEVVPRSKSLIDRSIEVIARSSEHIPDVEKQAGVGRTELKDSRVQDFSLEGDIGRFKGQVELFRRMESGEKLPLESVFGMLRTLGIDMSEISTMDREDTAGIQRQIKLSHNKIRSRLGEIQLGLKKRIERAKRVLEAPQVAEPEHMDALAQVERPSLAAVEQVFSELAREQMRPLLKLDLGNAYEKAAAFMERTRPKGARMPEWFLNLQNALDKPVSYRFIKRSGDILHFADDRYFANETDDPNDDDLMRITVGLPLDALREALTQDQLDALTPYEVQRKAA